VPANPETVARLRCRIAAIERGGSGSPRPDGALPLGLADIDAHLPWGGLAAGAVHEFLDGDGTAAGLALAGTPGGALTGFAAALAGRAQCLRARPLVWIAPRSDTRESLYGPGLAAFGLDPAHLVAVRIPPGGDFAATALWAMEEALRTPAVGLVAAEIEDLDLTASRRLQLAAEAGGGLGLLLRRDTPHRDGASLPPTASVSRWRISALPGGPPEFAGLHLDLPGAPRWRAELLRARGAVPKTWQLEWRDGRNDDTHENGGAAGGFALVSPLRDRPLPKTATARIDGDIRYLPTRNRNSVRAKPGQAAR
jgi:protein ImuA